jgi:DNA-directed RNA polymerase subunit RPC12/RpoP
MKYRCLECDGNLIQTDSDIVCINCGLIAQQIYEKPSIQLISSEGSYGSQYASISEQPSKMKTLGTFIGAFQKKNFVDSSVTFKWPPKRIQRIWSAITSV